MGDEKVMISLSKIMPICFIVNTELLNKLAEFIMFNTLKTFIL